MASRYALCRSPITGRALIILLGIVVGVTGCERSAAPGAPLLEGMGAYHRPITTRSEGAQRYFNQGLVLTYAFNHAEAARSFREAAHRDPSCAMCFWGIALALGPNINAAMEIDDVAEAVEASRRAVELSLDGTEVERALIEALAVRYQEPPPEDRGRLDRRYAEVLTDVYERFPNDFDTAVLFADAWMNTTPWDYWLSEEEPRPEIAPALRAIEGVLGALPLHPGANHLYIHLVESVDPERGIAAAERLENLVPGAGHLVHMPSHIYLRVGRYHDATVANERAIEADASYDAACRAIGLYPLVYMPHNRHFLWAAATMEGRSALAIDAARKLARAIDPDEMRQPGLGTLQHYSTIPYYALVRFGKWGDILLTPRPDEDLLYPTAIWLYARSIALTRMARFDEAAEALEALARIAEDPALEKITIWDLNTMADLVRIARHVAAGELAAADGRRADAIAELEAAIAIEDALNYDEPPPWHAPVRHTLGVVLLASGRPGEAEAVYRADLERHPENGWALFGLLQSLRLQGKRRDIAGVETRFQRAWQHADVELTASRM